MPAFTRLSFAALLAVMTSIAHAGALPANARLEIEAVLTALKTSGCQFNRNGTWHSGADAQAHLTKKLTYLADKNLIKSAEEFIAQGASTSSVSGKPYQVRCGAAALRRPLLLCSTARSGCWINSKPSGSRSLEATRAAEMTEMTNEAIAQEIKRQLSKRAATSSVCPSEIARALDDDELAWRALMPQVREVADLLRDEGRLRITRKGVDVPSDTLHQGAIRLARGPGFAEWPDPASP